MIENIIKICLIIGWIWILTSIILVSKDTVKHIKKNLKLNEK
jgi:hypothetical protein